ncbi:hypothetical protein MUY27_04175 [Mucilaginibacter sp. RS28]|uniref:Uncharacterized protein n=1 Tax=Mucilaginibacter straminoryzae TaxID=2932774 RepID=A0A9X2BAK6_9SPHI|nr:hypothetical protein [Mucilaginibacter straminoryzae]MCJ8208892.1 hypothetical protein [Mucilaginibacter straminoryzae]
MKVLAALAGGLAGAVVLTGIHQVVKKKRGHIAPRMDLLGMETLIKLGRKAKINLPDEDTLYQITLAGDLLSNTVYYSTAAIGPKQTWLKGALLGLGAGVGAVYLPKPMGLNPDHSNRTEQTKVLSVVYYLVGGLVAAGVIKLLKAEKVKEVSSV